MKKRYWVVILAAIALILVTLIFVSQPTEKAVEKTVNVQLYHDGVPIRDMEIQIDGQMTRNWTSRETIYVGQFIIDKMSLTSMEGTIAQMIWEDGRLTYFSYYFGGDYIWLDIERIWIDEDMEHMSIGFTDGSVAATSADLVSRYSMSRGD